MKSFARMLYPYLVWIAIMILAPMLLIVLYAFTKQGNSVLTLQFTLDNFARFFSDSIFPNVLWRSLKIALITTVICVLLGYPAAYFIAKLDGNRKSVMVLLITLPMWINMLVRTYAWRGILLNFPVSSEFKVFVGMVYNFIPFMILQIYTSLTKMDQSLLTAAEDLGANKVQTFLRVTLPLSMPGVVSGTLLTFIPASGDFVNAVLLGNSTTTMIGQVIDSRFFKVSDYPTAAALSFVLMVAILALVAAYIRRAGTEELL